MTALWVFLGIATYLCSGYYIGEKSTQVWRSKDNDSVAAKLLFPFNAHCRKVGEAEFIGPEVFAEMLDDEGDFMYRAAMVFGWPLKSLFAIPGIAFFSVPGLLGQAVHGVASLRGKTAADDMNNLLPAASDDVHASFEKARQAENLMRELAEIRRANLDMVEEQRLQFDAAIEAEKTSLLDDADLPQLTDGSSEE